MYFIQKTQPMNLEVIIKLGDGFVLSIPCDEANTDYQAYLAWVAEGNTAEEWIEEPIEVVETTESAVK